MYKSALVILIHIVLIQNLCAQSSSARYQEIDRIVTKLYDEGKMHGGILIAEGDSIIFQNAFGMADRTLEVPNTTKTRFTINSMEKMFVAILILQLVEDDSISLHDPISKHLPWFSHTRSDEITIHQFLSHRSGLKDYFPEQINGNLNTFIPQREVLDKMAQRELDFEPGNGFNYSNTGYLLLGEVIMKYRKADYYEVLRERIFVHDNYKGDGGSKSTLHDLHKFMLAVGTDKLLHKESWDLMFQKYSLPKEATVVFGAHFDPYGYGCSILDLPYKDDQTAKAIGHGGAGYGSSNFMLKFIDSNRIIINWNNEFLPPKLNELYEALAKL